MRLKFRRRLVLEKERVLITLENPFTVNVLSHMPGKDAKLVCVAGAYIMCSYISSDIT